MSDSINSSQNSKYRLWLSLLKGPGVKKNKQFLLMGRKLVPESVYENPQVFTTLLVGPKINWEFPTPPHVKIIQLSGDLFRTLDIFDTKFPILVGNKPSLPNVDLSQPPNGLELLCTLGDPHNLGSLIRNSLAMGVSKIILLPESTSPYTPKALRASSGAALKAPLFVWDHTIKELHSPFYALDLKGESIHTFTWPRDVRLLVGQEGQGIPTELAPVKRVKIPMSGQMESLNAVSATTIALFHYNLTLEILLSPSK